MEKTLAVFVRVVAVLASLAVETSASAQDQLASVPPQSFDWAMPSPRAALSEKGSAFLRGGEGKFVTRKAMLASNSWMRSPPGARSADLDAPMDLSSQFNYIFGGVPGPATTLKDGQKLFTACEVHNCLGRRAFMVTDVTEVSVLSVGFISVECPVPGDTRKAAALPTSCDTVPTLTIYYQDHQARQAAVALGIITWARLEVAQLNRSDRMKVQEKFLH